MKKIMSLVLLVFINCSCMAQTKIEKPLSGVVIASEQGSIEIAANHLPGECAGHGFPESVIELSTKMDERFDPGRMVEITLKESDPICPVHGSVDQVNESIEPHSLKISPELAHELLAENPSIKLIDVRLLSEYLQSHIPHSQRITYLEEDPDEFIRIFEKEIPDKDSIVMVYCRTGRRSSAAAEYLNKSGYTNVLDLGGIEEWKYEIEKGK